MKIAITSNGSQLSSKTHCDFSRASRFIVCDTDTGEILDVLDNPAVEIAGGGGLEAAELLVQNDVEALVTDGLDPSAGDILAASGVGIFRCEPGTVREMLHRYQAGELEAPFQGVAAEETGVAGGVSPSPVPRDSRMDLQRGQAEEALIGHHPEYVCVECGARLPQAPGESAPTQVCESCRGVMIKAAVSARA